LQRPLQSGGLFGVRDFLLFGVRCSVSDILNMGNSAQGCAINQGAGATYTRPTSESDLARQRPSFASRPDLEVSERPALYIGAPGAFHRGISRPESGSLAGIRRECILHCFEGQLMQIRDPGRDPVLEFLLLLYALLFVFQRDRVSRIGEPVRCGTSGDPGK